MAINFDHTNSSSITLKGPDGNALDNYNFIFPNTENANASLLLSGEASIGSISGLQQALNSKVNNSATGSAALASTGLNAGQVVVLGNDNKIPDSLIPSVAIRDIFEVQLISGLTGLSCASIGDIGIVTDDHVNYILCSSGANAYLDLLNWKELKFTNQTVESVNGLVGDVVLNGQNVYLSSGQYDTCSLNYAVQDLYDSKVTYSDLINYATTGYVSGQLNLYATTGYVTGQLNNYETTGDFSGTIANYSTTSQIQSCLSTYYVSTGLTGSAAQATVGTSAGNVVALDGNSKIPVSLIPKISITDTFVIEETGGAYGLTSLTLAQQGDIAVVTGTNNLANFILTGSDYSDVNQWQALAASMGTVQKVNNVDPVNGNVTLNSTNIYVVDSNTIYDETLFSYAISGLLSKINNISGNYLTTGQANTLLGSYVTTGAATGSFNEKANSTHQHELENISGLTGCLDSITTFYKGNGDYSVKQIGVNAGMNIAYGDYSVALGYGAFAKQNYEIAHSAGLVTWNGGGNPGDAQSSKLISRCSTNSSSLTEVGKICLSEGTFAMFSVDVIGRAPNKYAAFKIEGSAYRNGDSYLLDNNSTNTYVNTSNAYYVEVADGGQFGSLLINVSGDATSEMNWVTYSNVVKLK